MEFQAFPKIPRLRRGIVITEKIDGTNAAVVIEPAGDISLGNKGTHVTVESPTGVVNVGAQSRRRLITPADDNYGFARWVFENAGSLAADLGPGRHFGEWWGAGIQRRYGLEEKRFYLFNALHWREIAFLTPRVGVVPILYEGPFADDAVDSCLQSLRDYGSVAAEGFMQPEGIIVYHTASSEMFKVTCEKDEEHKHFGKMAE